jgi:glycosyltransferase involved in cell wall biosynthesis
VKVAYVYPTYWPYIRRGAERCIHDFTTYLSKRGHEVELITSTPGKPRVAYDGLTRVTYLRQVSHPLAYKYVPMLRMYAFGLDALPHLFRKKYDAAHLWSYSMLPAPLLQRVQGLPYLFHLMVQDHWWPGKLDRLFFKQLIVRANKVAALTPNGAAAISRAFGVPVVPLAAPVDLDVFRPCAPKDLNRPQVLFTGDLGDPRKGGMLLLRAWDEIHRRCPEAMLVLAGPFGLIGFDVGYGIYTLERLDLVRDPAARAAIEIRGPGSLDTLPAWYSEAAVTVLPSVHEAFGMVVTESLACGTPVVCSSDGGPGEIVSTPEVGRTVPLYDYFDLLSSRRAGELAEAVVQAIELARQPSVSQRCRAWAEPWSLERVGAQAEAMLEEMASHDRRTGPVAQVAG